MRKKNRGNPSDRTWFVYRFWLGYHWIKEHRFFDHALWNKDMFEIFSEFLESSGDVDRKKVFYADHSNED